MGVWFPFAKLYYFISLLSLLYQTKGSRIMLWNHRVLVPGYLPLHVLRLMKKKWPFSRGNATRGTLGKACFVGHPTYRPGKASRLQKHGKREGLSKKEREWVPIRTGSGNKESTQLSESGRILAPIGPRSVVKVDIQKAYDYRAQGK